MRIVNFGLAASAATLLLAGCTSGGVLGRDRPDEFAVSRSQPLVIPPDFALSPPRPGETVPQGADSRTQAVEALFGGPAPRAESEQQMIEAAGGNNSAAAGARSVAGDPSTQVVDKGPVTQTILAAPAGAGRDATVTTPQQ